MNFSKGKAVLARVLIILVIIFLVIFIAYVFLLATMYVPFIRDLIDKLLPQRSLLD